MSGTSEQVKPQIPEEVEDLPVVGLEAKQLYLLGDVGGTNLRLELRNHKSELLHRSDKLTNVFKSLSEALRDFFSDYNIDHKNILFCLCIAAKVQNNKTVSQSNIPWTLTDGAVLKKEFGRSS